MLILTFVEACLYIKMNLFFVLDTHGPTTTGRAYSIPDIMYQMVMVIVTLTVRADRTRASVCFVCAADLRQQFLFQFVVYNLVKAPFVGFRLTEEPLEIVLIVVVLVHNTTGMCCGGTK